MLTFISLCLLGAVVLGLIISTKVGQRERGLPPGPQTVPIVGNIHLLPKAEEMHLKFMEWSRKYGEIVSLKIGTGTMIILSSPSAIKGVVDKHGWEASSRPPNYLAGLAVGGYHILFALNTSQLRNLRKTVARFFSPQHSVGRVPVEAAESSQLLFDMMTHPENFSKSIRRYTNSIAMVAVYGQRISCFTSPQLDRFYNTLHQFLHILVPGTYPPLDVLPALKYLPTRWAPWRSVCGRIKSEMVAFHVDHSTAAEKRVLEAPQCSDIPKDNRSYLDYIMRMGLSYEEYQIFSYTGVSLVEAGSDTSAAFLLSLILILGLYPEHQERARLEIEAVIGTTRMPELEDFKRMPFVDALVKEVVRIRPSFPFGVPHSTTEDIHYKGYVVPKDSTVFLNIYSIFHNPDLFAEPEVFNPDRFLGSEHGTRPGMDTDFRDNFNFGAGRRICPGQYVARTTMQLSTMRLIWAFTFGPPVDARTNRLLTRDLDCYAYEFVVMPRPFNCAIQARSAEHRELVARTFNEAKSLLGQYEHD
ncbi:cytochrome P450 [Mycena belliarum]|uniref:Cytochrome P450 n=1 Tax=Mycena belliarum TaxID=1033014 RepID=A0AAD6TTF1_9AGAR|nr:cytochrome P450 [Mycena belliae]